MLFKQNYKQLAKELRTIARNTNLVRAAKEAEKQKAMLTYKKMTAIKARQPTAEIDQQLANLSTAKPQFRFDNTLVKKLAVEEGEPAITEKHRLNHLTNVHTFLNSQRVYTELLERYNPGLTMTQEDNVRKSAERVGLQVPKN